MKKNCSLAARTTTRFAACVLLSLACAAAFAQFEEGRLERVQALRTPRLDGLVPTYYTPGYERHARDLQHFVTEEMAFARRRLDVQFPLSLAVLDRAQWSAAEHQLPYPMPSVGGEPPVALMPADWAAAEDFFAKKSEIDSRTRAELALHHLTWQEASHRSGDLIGGHELGHAVVGNHLQQPQHHVSLDDFESKYMDILAKDGENYGWYEGQFLEQVKRVYAQRGLGFLKSARKAFPQGSSPVHQLGNAETLPRLEQIAPGFSAWAASLEARRKL